MPGERSIHHQDTDRPPPRDDGPLDAILDSLEEARASIEDLNEGQDEINGSLRGIHGAVTESERTLGGKLNAMHADMQNLGKAIAQLSRDVARAMKVSEAAKTTAETSRREVEELREELRRAASG